ncbi:hypothetical protein ROLI_036790 [Roseobacter fucihabitans]|uniref:Uncharacterized protein n=1 Tax=Roseobacter fucihabitans TaxID=1537242 RepID=A0ABZ2BWY6_9RHOB|nr:hypothetical protein [Roseobacter litoralis]MBC6966332.1 hypothetical protein [Roseobacter litoralis]
MSKYGPSKKELRFRLAFSVAGLLLLCAALAYRGMPQGVAMFETIGIAGAFFGGTLIWTLKKLVRKEYSDAS